MKLTELNPKWIGVGHEPDMVIFGIRFDCPHCREQRLAVMFTPFIDPKGWIQKFGGEFPLPGQLKWNRVGDTFETLSLAPSVNTEFHGHWHGFIQSGEVTQ
jgi:hypothetical protein